MSIKQRIEQDLKSALLSGNKPLATTLRGIKSVILYEEVAKGAREQGLGDKEIIALLAKEAKKRQESADLYKQGGNQEKADAEIAERAVIEQYLPKQLSDEELDELIEAAMQEIDETGPQAMGKIIGAVKQRSEGRADGGRIAAAVKAKLG